MELLVNFFSSLGVILGTLTVVLAIIILRWAVPQMRLQRLIERVNYLQGEQDRLDKEISANRIKIKENQEREEILEQRVQNDHQRILECDATILGMARYIKRLELSCERSGLPLPRKDDLGVTWPNL